MRLTGRQRNTIVVVVVVAIAIVALLVPTEIGGWAPLAHVVCQTSPTPVDTVHAWIPAIMLNSPYGGLAWGNGTVPSGAFSGPGGPTNYSLAAANGSAVWGGFRGTFSLRALENVMVWGPGANDRCTSEYSVEGAFSGGSVLSGTILGEGNTSDAFEPTSLAHWTSLGDVNLTIANGFSLAFGPPISTCGSATASNVTEAVQFQVLVPFNVGGTTTPIPYILPFAGTFHYVFPADFGSWAVDDLSQPGGPGGGWSFSYSQCV